MPPWYDCRKEGAFRMNQEVHSTRQQLLDLLLRHKGGLTVDELGSELGVSRNAVRQHLSALESEGLVALGEIRRSVGRPSHVYTLTPAGQEQFPRQYGLLSGLVLETLRDLHGEEGTRTLLRQIAGRLVQRFAPQVRGADTPEKARELAAILTELGYEAEAGPEGRELTAINCVYHHLAETYPEVCELDLELIGGLTGARVEHAECMVRGGQKCRFVLHPESGAK
jgi:predicted ArsR family transcriptional regulator